MEENNNENKVNAQDFFSSPKTQEEVEPQNNIVAVSEDINPLTTDINKVSQNISSGDVVGKKEVSRAPKFYVSTKSYFNNETNDDEMLSLYVGKNYGKISSRFINFSAIIFGPFYYMYRKMLILGILIFVGLLFLHHQYSNYIVDAVYYLIFGVIFNILYMSKSIRKTNKIKNKYSNYDKYSMGRVCSKKGGRSILLALFGFIISLIILVAFCTYFYLDPMTKFLRKFGIVYTYENNKIEIKFDRSVLNEDEMFDDKYGYYLIKSDDSSKEYFNMDFQNSKFIDDSDELNYKYIYTLGNDSKFDQCKIELYGLKGYSTSEKFIAALANYNKTNYNTLTINGIKWYYLYHSGISGTGYYYSTMIDNKVFVLRYFKDNTAVYDCLDYNNSVINSVKLK